MKTLSMDNAKPMYGLCGVFEHAARPREEISMDWRVAKRLEFNDWAMPFVEDCYRTALYLVESEPEAQDLVQKSFVRAYRAWQPFDSSSECRLWLYRIMASVYSRKEQPSVVILENTTDESVSPTWHDDSRFAEAPGQLPTAFISEGDVLKAVRLLPSHIRLTLVLSFLGRCSYDEIAEIAGIPLEYVGFRLREGRHRLSESLKRCSEEQQLGAEGSWGQEKMNG